MQTNSSEIKSLMFDAEKQKEVFSFILQAFYADPKSFEELKCSILLVSDNTSPTPNKDRFFLLGAFALLQYMAEEKNEKEEI